MVVVCWYGVQWWVMDVSHTGRGLYGGRGLCGGMCFVERGRLPLCDLIVVMVWEMVCGGHLRVGDGVLAALVGVLDLHHISTWVVVCVGRGRCVSCVFLAHTPPRCALVCYQRIDFAILLFYVSSADYALQMKT